MARPLIHSARVLRTGQPLSLDQIRKAAPAVFAEEAHHSRGERYLYVPTIRPLEQLMDNGWGVYEVGQQRARAADRDPYTKHMLRLRKLDDFKADAYKGEGIPEVILINAHDGTASYDLRAGFFRFICSNGLIVGNTLGGFKVRHTKGPTTSLEVLEAGERVVTEKFPKMVEHIGLLKQVRLNDTQQFRLAHKAVTLRYGTVNPPFQPAELLNGRRPEDAGNEAWHVLNRIQENVMDGGWETRSAMFGRKSMVRPVERVSAVATINSGLWDEAINIVTEA